ARHVAVVPAEHQVRLALESPPDLGVAHQARVQGLDRDGALALQVGGAVHDAHAALAEHAVDLVALADPRAGRDDPGWEHALARIGERDAGPELASRLARPSATRTEPRERRQLCIASAAPVRHDAVLYPQSSPDLTLPRVAFRRSPRVLLGPAVRPAR